jgi:hypothetical protein
LLGDLCYSLMIFGCYHVIEHQFSILSKEWTNRLF